MAAKEEAVLKAVPPSAQLGSSAKRASRLGIRSALLKRNPKPSTKPHSK